MYSILEYSVLEYYNALGGIYMKSIYDEDYIEIITRLRIIRTGMNITQFDLANKMGKTQSFVSKIETCERRLDVIEFLKWLDALNISFSDVIPSKYVKGE